MKLNILYTIGLSLIFLSILAVRPTTYNSAAALLAALFLSEAVYLFGPAKNVLAKFDFPILPWIIFPIYGIILGSSLIKFYKAGRLKSMVRYLEITAVIMMALTAAYVIMGVPFEYQYKATLPFICLIMALTAYILSLSIQLYEISKRDISILKPLKAYGRFALPVYFIHYVFVITIPHILGLENTFSLNESLIFLTIFLLAGYLVLRKLEKPRKHPS
jgi:peptidoglycan/LPS O-acetylase OafA/YrhL